MNRVSYLCVEINSAFVSDNNPNDNENCIEPGLSKKAIFEPAYPNPSSDQTTIRAILPESGGVTVSIVDLAGQLRKRVTFDERPSGLNVFVIDLQLLESGTYFISINHSSGEHLSRIIKQ